MNESIYYSVDSLHEAISEGKKVSFKYFYYDTSKKPIYQRDGGVYIVSPAALSWFEENYYLIGILDGQEGLRHFRVDRMDNVKTLDEIRDPAVKNFKLTDYTKKIFGMYGGEETDVRLRMNNKLAHTVIDRFGKDITMVPDGDNHFTILIQVAISPVFCAWIFQFQDKCEVLSPQSLKDDLKHQVIEFIRRLGDR
jgi:predicted DNA-binding transcriptional regulator YafY